MEPVEKKAKNDHDDDYENKFQHFKFSELLNDSPETKHAAILGKFYGSDDNAVVLLEKTPFTEDSIKSFLCEESDSKNILHNDIYSTDYLYPNKHCNDIKTTLIYPATEKHIVKYSSQEAYIIQESPEDYKNITLPYLEKSQFDIKWIHNILSKKTESERIVLEDPDPEVGFILLPDLKWNGVDLNNMYLTAIVHKIGIKSLRDLDRSHLPLLENILTKGKEAILNRFGVLSAQLRIYIHYQPSFYHFHVHFTHVRFQAPGSGVERAHLLDDVIANIRLSNTFYQDRTMTFFGKRNDGLTKSFIEAGKLNLQK